MAKRIFAVIIVVAICFSLFTTTISAVIISTFDISSATKSSILYFNGTKATCISEYSDSNTVASINIVQTLEKHAYLWTWNPVCDPWTKGGTNVRNLSLTNTKSGLSSGTYRVKSVFTVTLQNGKTESVTVYSEEKTI